MNLKILTMILMSLSLMSGRAEAKEGNTSIDNINSSGDVTSTTEVHASTSIAEADYPVSIAYAPATLSTAPCRIGVSAGGSGTAFGFSFGGSTLDKGCDRRMDVILLHQLGDTITARELMYDKPSIKKVLLQYGNKRRSPKQNRR